jgi:hypothetical protein
VLVLLSLIKKCESENIAMTPASSAARVIMGNNEIVKATHMAMITLTLNHYKYDVECLVLDNLVQYDLILGNPWLMAHNAEMSFKRKQIIIQIPDGNQLCLNAHVMAQKYLVKQEFVYYVLGFKG